MSESGRLIVFEGIDGSGKSTAIRRVAAALEAEGHSVTMTREETEGWTGEAVRRSIAERADPWTTLHLFLADRASHQATLRLALEAGNVVLCDRYLHSTLAYQSVTLADQLDNPLDALRLLHEPWCRAPDGVVLLDLDPQKAVSRVAERGAATPYEKVGFLEKVRAAYLELAETDGLAIVAADQSPDDVAADALKALRPWLA